MALGRKTGGKDFEKGHIGMGGRPKLTDEEKAINRLTDTDYSIIVNKYWGLSTKNLEEHQNDPEKPQIDLIVIEAITRARLSGDLDRMEKLFNRTIGKVPDTIIHGGAVVGLNAEIESDDETLAHAARAYKEALKA